MAIKIYQLDQSTLTFSEISAGTFASPAALNLSPGGTASVKKLYIRNDDITKYYVDLILKPTSVTGGDIVNGTISIKLLSGDTRPSDSDWSGALANSSASLESPISGGPVNTRLPELGASGSPDTQYYPFWVYVAVTKGSPIGDLQFSLELEYTENTV